MTALPSAKPTVLIFKETLLPMSETFIDAQTRQLSSFLPRYIGLGRVTPSLAIPEDSIVMTRRRSAGARLRQKLYRRLGVAPRFHRQAANAGAALIHAHFASGGRSALRLARRLRIPLIVTLHGSDVTTRIDFRSRYKELWDQAALFLCVSEFIRTKAVEAGFPKDKLRVHYVGIDREALQLQDQPRRQELVLFVGRLVEKKGCEFLLRAMQTVGKTHPHAKAVVIGEGPLRSSLETLAAQLGISCQFLGAQPASVVRQWLPTARVFCVPSITAANGDSEGLPTVIMEALAMGTPVAGFCHAGIPEIVVDGRTGLLAPEGDCRRLALNILRFLQDDGLWSRCVEQGAALLRARFDLKLQTRQLEQVYEELCRPIQNISDPELLFTEPLQLVAG